MDKQNFINYIKTIGLDGKLEGAILNYVESHNFDEKLVGDVAGMLELAADEEEAAANELSGMVTEMENYKVEIKKAADEYDGGVDQVVDNFGENLGKIAEDEAKVGGDHQESNQPVTKVDQQAEKPNQTPSAQQSQPIKTDLTAAEMVTPGTVPAADIPVKPLETYEATHPDMTGQSTNTASAGGGSEVATDLPPVPTL